MKRIDATGGKYAPLFHHLTTLDGNWWSATFAEVEGVLGSSLPDTARRRPQWWANQTGRSHTQACAWMEAGWRTTVALKGETVVFERAERNAVSGGQRHRSRVLAVKSRRLQVLGHVTERRPQGRVTPLAVGLTSWGGQTFRFAAHIVPETGPDGEPITDEPHLRYAAANSTPLNRHGRGPFCRFEVLGLPPVPGVYAVTVAQKLAYVGIARKSLKERWGPRGFATISPKNCFKGGQSTNCKVNHAILLAAREGERIDLWLHQTDGPRPLEARLIRELAPPWNDQR